MFDIFLEKPRRACLVFGTVGLIAAVYLMMVIDFTRGRNAGNIGALLDDTWIHVRFAWHISQGEGLSYNEGVLTSGATSPLWVMILAIPFAVLQPDVFQQVDIAIYMSALGHVLSVLAITGLGWWATRRAWIGFAAGLIVALTGRYIWMGLTGMEITTFTTLCIFAIWSHMHDVRISRVFGWRTGVLVALATLARPEAYLLALLIGIDAFVYIPLRNHQRWQASVAALWQGRRGIMAYIVLAGTYPLVTLIIDGYPVPNTFRAKSYLGEEFPELPRALFWMANKDHGPLLIALAVVGGLYFAWKALPRQADSALIGIWAPLFVLGVLYMGSERYVVNHSRYVAPSIPFVALSAVVGLWVVSRAIAHLLKREHVKQMTVLALVAILASGTFWRGSDQGAQVANDVYQLRAMHVQAGQWFADHTTPGTLIALNDVGAIVHISDREVLDLEGLVSPEVIDATGEAPSKTCEHDLALARLMMQEEPLLIGVFPWWYPCLVGWDGALQAEAVFAIQGPTVLAGGEMVIYFPIWENWPMQRAVPAEAETVNIALQDRIVLTAYEVVQNNTELQITLWWSAQGQPSADYHVFVHMIDVEGQIVEMPDGRTLQSDGIPQQRANSAFHTNWWQAGDLIPDRHVIVLDDALLQEIENFSLNIGMYIYPSGQRLQRVDGGGDVINLPISIRRIAADVAQ